jgi:hypothetical protein
MAPSQKCSMAVLATAEGTLMKVIALVYYVLNIPKF